MMTHAWPAGADTGKMQDWDRLRTLWEVLQSQRLTYLPINAKAKYRSVSVLRSDTSFPVVLHIICFFFL